MFEIVLTYILGKTTDKPRLSMEGLPSNYTKLTVEHGIKINMTNYPGSQIIEPNHAVINHLHEVISGWKSGQIKWVRLSNAEVEMQKKTLHACASEEAGPVESLHDNGSLYFSWYISNSMGMQVN